VLQQADSGRSLAALASWRTADCVVLSQCRSAFILCPPKVQELTYFNLILLHTAAIAKQSAAAAAAAGVAHS
jgi:hypothetical protein